jgi:hypothetical protein
VVVGRSRRRLTRDLEADEQVAAEGRRHLLQSRHRRGVLAGLESGDRGLSRPGAFGQFGLRDLVGYPEGDDLAGDLLVWTQALASVVLAPTGLEVLTTPRLAFLRTVVTGHRGRRPVGASWVGRSCGS